MQKGILRKWDDAKGFGFIRIENENQDIFFHISTLQRSERRPVIGDVIYYTVVTDQSGRKNTANASIEGVKSAFAAPPAVNPKLKSRTKSIQKSHLSLQGVKKSGGFFKNIVFIVMLLAIVQVYQKYSSPELNAVAPAAEHLRSMDDMPAATPQFECAGKNRCSQMTSCEEAMFYLRNCPGSLTDGDGDGRPCEDQWCGH